MLRDNHINIPFEDNFTTAFNAQVSLRSNLKRCSRVLIVLTETFAACLLNGEINGVVLPLQAVLKVEYTIERAKQLILFPIF